ncbi:MAG: radical SAM protein [Eubacteriales bacterium]
MTDRKKRNPTNGTFELTGRCCLQCKMCLVRVDEKRIRESGLHERSAAEWIDMARQAADAGTLGLLLTGGEPTLRSDFCEIYEAVSRMGFVLTLYTNAVMLSEQVLEVLRKSPPHKIGVTMYGASNETYARLCGMPDGYDRFINGLQQLSELPSLLEIRTTVVQDNVDDLPAMQRFVRERFGADRVLQISTFVMKGIRGSVADAVSCRLGPQEHFGMLYPGIIRQWEKIRDGLQPKAGRDIRQTEHTLPLPPPGAYLFSSCGAGTDSYTIDWSGRMYACELLDRGYTEPFVYGFDRAWEQLPGQYPKSRVPTECAACPDAAFCSSCPAYRLGETGDWFGIPRFACETAALLHRIVRDTTENRSQTAACMPTEEETEHEKT